MIAGGSRPGTRTSGVAGVPEIAWSMWSASEKANITCCRSTVTEWNLA